MRGRKTRQMGSRVRKNGLIGPENRNNGEFNKREDRVSRMTKD